MDQETFTENIVKDKIGTRKHRKVQYDYRGFNQEVDPDNGRY